MGHHVVPIQENAATDRDAFGVLDGVIPERFHGPPDLLLVTRCWGWTPGYWLADLIAAARSRGVVSAALHLDRFAGLPRAEVVDTDPMFRVDHVLSADGDFDWEAHGVRHHWLRPGVLRGPAVVPSFGIDDPGCEPAEPFTPQELRDRGWPPDPLVGFVGSDGYHPEWPHRPQLVDWLRDNYGARFLQAGGSTGKTVRQGDLNRLYATVPCIGDSIFATPESRYWSDRFYETWGRGGRLVFPRFELLEDEVGDYPSWDVGDWNGLATTIDACLAGEYPVVTTDLHDFVRDHCTYHDRLRELLAVALPEGTT